MTPGPINKPVPGRDGSTKVHIPTPQQAKSLAVEQWQRMVMVMMQLAAKRGQEVRAKKKEA